MDRPEHDPKGLIRESYLIEGITAGECRSIFLDWALSLPEGADMSVVVPALLARYDSAQPGHPMSAVLRDALTAAPPGGRRGGRAARFAGGRGQDAGPSEES